MKPIIPINQKCPGPAEFEAYLKQSGNDNMNSAFEKHIADCPLCKEAIEGYQLTKTVQITRFSDKAHKVFKKQHFGRIIRFNQLSYAASIAVLVGVVSFYFLEQKVQIMLTNQYQPSIELFASENIPSDGQKKLTKKINEQYWYLGQNNVIAVNDAIIAPENIEAIIKNSESINTIIIEIKNSNFEYSNLIIKQIKETKKVPVLTF